MKYIDLYKSDLKCIVDDEDYGILSEFQWRIGCTGHYVVRTSGKKTLYIHREIMKPVEEMVVDHVNHNKLDNRKENLRVCTRQQNTFNFRPDARGNPNGYKGVSKNYNSFSFRIRYGSMRIVRYGYKSAEDAALAYNQTALKYHGQYACLNLLPNTFIKKTPEMLKQHRKCDMCGEWFMPFHKKQKFCGSPKGNGTCSWKHCQEIKKKLYQSKRTKKDPTFAEPSPNSRF